MEISISTQRVLGDIRQNFHIETSKLDAEAKTKILLDEDKDDLLARLLTEALSEVTELFSKYTGPEISCCAEDSADIPEFYHLVLYMSHRRANGKHQQFADAIHAFLVNDVLSRYYIAATIADLAKIHADAREIERLKLVKLINTKVPPFMTGGRYA